MKINSIVRDAYKKMCKASCAKVKDNQTKIDYKIQRCVDLGKTIHTYDNGHKIVRYHKMNFLVGDYEIMMAWFDFTAPEYKVSEQDKKEYDIVRGVQSTELTTQEKIDLTVQQIKKLSSKRDRMDTEIEKRYNLLDKLKEESNTALGFAATV
ncbi:hypothetical protein PQ478_09275 [Alkalihalophilus pseudofirmus]|uniref:hypothetical protein n=1 Tax=Alkalihalophilus pseudofirmus TaxID=79885 RepID=UPI00259B0EC9|nr:hypothetical protein [Alkalihalophilus pseudofirmus]WEG18660.1 hypothetical protein PQ478_09275 [Alkalihalophilus pseudofirmus]